MAFIERDWDQLSQLVVRDPFKEDAQSIDVITINNTGGVTIPLGGVVYRAIGADSTATWDVVADNTVLAVGANDGLPVNEFAVVFGDKYKYQKEVVVPDGVDTKALAYVRGPSQLKSKLVEAFLADAGLTAAEIANVELLMSRQDILVNETVGTLG